MNKLNQVETVSLICLNSSCKHEFEYEKTNSKEVLIHESKHNTVTIKPLDVILYCPACHSLTLKLK